VGGPDRPRRVIGIVNAAAGPGLSKARFMEIRQSLHGEPFGPVYLTLRRGHAEEWARTFRNEAGYLVIGGDGTLHEVVSGMEIRNQAVAVVPLGTATSLARDLGDPTLADACGGIETGRRGKLDLVAVIMRRGDGSVRRCRSVSSVAVGLPVEVARKAVRWGHNLGPLAYPVAALAAGLRPPRFEVSVRYDRGRWTRKTVAGFLAGNTRHVMSVRIFPDASPFDGRMVVLELVPGFLRLGLQGLSVLTRTRLYESAKPLAARRVSVLFGAPRPVAVDGEIYDGVVRVELRMLPGGLTIFMPTGAHA